MKKYLICTLLAISVLQINANTFEQANQAYNKKDYEQAVALYTQCVEQGYSNATLYYNLGNAHFKADHLSQAILCKWSKCIYPYDSKGKPLPLEQFKQNNEAFSHLFSNSDKLTKGRDIEDDKYWYLFGRTH